MPFTAPLATIVHVATAFPATKYTQDEMKFILGVNNTAVTKLLSADHIRTRHLYLNTATLPMPKETPEQLYAKFLNGVGDIGLRAARKVLGDRPATDIDVVVAVTSSGLALPGVSAILVRDLGLRNDVHRLDIVGMGCNAGMTALKNISSLLHDLANRQGRAVFGLLLCCEINSALYVRDDSARSGVVNSLFGDGAAAVLLTASPDSCWHGRSVLPAPVFPHSNDSFGAAFAGAVAAELVAAQAAPVIPAPVPPKLHLVDFRSATLPEFFDDMKYVVDPDQQQLNFHLSKQIPFIVGGNVHIPVMQLLEAHRIDVSRVAHWIVHTGGAAVIEGICKNLGLKKDHAMRHTISVLRDYGNISSGSFLASFERLAEEHIANEQRTIASGDIAILIAMGPGTTIEVGLGVF